MKRLVAWLCLIAILFCTSSAVMATEIDDKKNELKEVNQNIKDAEEELEKVREEQKQVASQLQSIESELAAKQDELVRVQKKLQETRASLEITKKELEEAILAAQEHEKLMGERLRALYMTGTASYLELLLEAKSLNDFLDRIQMIKYMAVYDNQVLEEMENYRDQVDQKRLELEREEQEIASLEAQITRQKQEIEQKKREREQLLAKLKDQEVQLQDDLAELERTSKELEKKIQQLLEEQRRREEERRKREQQRGQDRNKEQQNNENKYTGGVLAWPVPGFYRITSPFGYRTHPVYGTEKFHSGIDIGSNYVNGQRISIYGQDFVAAADGTVILSQWYGGYGNCVVIDHGGGLTTLYAHGSQRLVSVGQQVKRGQPVMKVGSTGVSTGAHAHFEVRKNGTPVDPLPYLGR